MRNLLQCACHRQWRADSRGFKNQMKLVFGWLEQQEGGVQRKDTEDKGSGCSGGLTMAVGGPWAECVHFWAPPLPSGLPGVPHSTTAAAGWFRGGLDSSRKQRGRGLPCPERDREPRCLQRGSRKTRRFWPLLPVPVPLPPDHGKGARQAAHSLGFL